MDQSLEETNGMLGTNLSNRSCNEHSVIYRMLPNDNGKQYLRYVMYVKILHTHARARAQ